MQKIVPHLWFDKEASEAAEFYMSMFENSKLVSKTFLEDTPSGTAELLSIQLAGQDFMLISAGPYFKFTPAVSFMVACSTTEERCERAPMGPPASAVHQYQASCGTGNPE